jgi:hypothetical protein
MNYRGLACSSLINNVTEYFNETMWSSTSYYVLYRSTLKKSIKYGIRENSLKIPWRYIAQLFIK